MRLPKKNNGNNNVGLLIKKTRKNLGLSQTKLAQKIGVSYQQIQKYENGKSQLTIPRLRQFANALGIPVQSFLDDESKAQANSLKMLNRKEIQLLTTFRMLKREQMRDIFIKLLDDVVTLSKSL